MIFDLGTLITSLDKYDEFGSKTHSIHELKDVIETLDETKLETLFAFGAKVFYATQRAGETLFVPCGMLVAEQVAGDGNVYPFSGHGSDREPSCSRDSRPETSVIYVSVSRGFVGAPYVWLAEVLGVEWGFDPLRGPHWYPPPFAGCYQYGGHARVLGRH